MHGYASDIFANLFIKSLAVFYFSSSNVALTVLSLFITIVIVSFSPLASSLQFTNGNPSSLFAVMVSSVPYSYVPPFGVTEPLPEILTVKVNVSGGISSNVAVMVIFLLMVTVRGLSEPLASSLHFTNL